MGGVALVGLLIWAVLGATRDPHERAMEDMLSAMNDLNKTLRSLNTPADVRRARPKLQRSAREFNNIAKRLKKLGKPSKKKQRQLRKKYEKKMTNALGELMANALRLASRPEVIAELDKIKMPDQGSVDSFW